MADEQIDVQDEEPALPAGTRLGKYEIIRKLGSGGMGAVYEAVHLEIGKHVAVKTLNPGIAAMGGMRSRFLREAQLTSRVRHPHIVDLTDMGNEGPHTFLVMELLQGEDLYQHLCGLGAMDTEELIDVMLPVCSAVAAAHAEKIIHRDLKPQNIFLARSPQGVHPKVLDFGISKLTDAVNTAGLTGTGSMVGTPFYLAPEQIQNARNTSTFSDQYALGVILYECLSGRRPFEAESLFGIFEAIVGGKPVPLQVLRPDLPAALDAIVLRAMSVTPSRRFSSVVELGMALLPFGSARAQVLWGQAFAALPQADAVTPPPLSLGGRALPATTPFPAGAGYRAGSGPLAGAGAATPLPPTGAGGTRLLDPSAPARAGARTPRPPVTAPVHVPRSRAGLWVVGILALIGAGSGLFLLLRRPPPQPAPPREPVAEPAPEPTPARSPTPRRPTPTAAAEADEDDSPTTPTAPPTPPPSAREPGPSAPAPRPAPPRPRHHARPRPPLPPSSPNGAPLLD